VKTPQRTQIAQDETQQEQAFILESKSQALTYAQREIDSLRVQLEDAKLREGFLSVATSIISGKPLKSWNRQRPKTRRSRQNTLEETGIIQRPSHIAKYGVHYVIALLIVIIITISCYAIFITR
jgi:hypothetical protein